MKDLKNLETYLLLEMLAIYTAEYTKMLTHKVKGDAFDTCELYIGRLQAAINDRKRKSRENGITQTDNNF